MCGPGWDAAGSRTGTDPEPASGGICTNLPIVTLTAARSFFVTEPILN